MINKQSFVLVLGGVLLSVGCATTSSITKPAAAPGTLIGAWELHADDEKPNGDFTPETVFFYPTHQLLVQGPTSFRGLYSDDQGTITMMVVHNGREVHIPRKFTLDSTGLHLANRATGAAHYRRIKAPFPQWALDDDWTTTEHGHITLRLPPKWTVKSDPPHPKGAQRLQATNASNTKMLILLLIPNDGSLSVDALIQGFGQQLMARSPNVKMELRQLGTPEFFGIPGTVYGIDGNDPNDPMTIRMVGTMKGPNTSLLAIFVFNHDALKELQLMGESLSVNLPQ